MAEHFSPADLQRMMEVEREVERTLMQFRENTEAVLAIFALARCARRLTRLYPEQSQEQTITLLCAFLRGDTESRAMQSVLSGKGSLLVQ